MRISFKKLYLVTTRLIKLNKTKSKNLKNIKKNFFDRDYFESGIETGKSCYVNYRWLPDLTIPMAYRITQYLGLKHNQTILDFGCSKGYLVKALRLLGFKAYGVDISSYAIKNADNDIKKYCKLIKNKSYNPHNKNFDWVISKDVMEHMTLDAINTFLKTYYKFSKNMFHVVPLGDEGKYRIKEMHLDKSHLQINDEKWWTKVFDKNGWKTLELNYKVNGVKDNWHKHHKFGNGFFKLKKK